ncbi:MAG: Crp/Fnr family transcriptional regulator [Bacteroidota bacterium]|nr:Crp/Fnr family transcriptional regulator [Bacteroidota bacterium]
MNRKCTHCQIKSDAARALTPEELVFLEDHCLERVYGKGETVFTEGKRSTHVVFIKSGLVKIHMQGPRYEQVLKIAPAGSYLGIQSMLSKQTHQYSATALLVSTICLIDSRSFEQLIRRNADFANQLIVYLCEDELNYFRRFVSQSQKQINGKLADTILFFANEIFRQDHFELPLTRKDLGTLLCTTRESATRAIKELSDLGVIQVNKSSFSIKNRKLLQTISKNG